MIAEIPDGVREESPVPLRALGLSVLALAAPAFGSVLAPDWIGEDSGVLLWLTALVPPFLLTYYRGWKGASLGLAGGMAALALAQVALVSFDLGAPDYTYLLWMVVTYVAVCTGVGVLAEVLRRERTAAESMALTDQLTRLANRRHATVLLDASFSAAVRGQPLSVVYFDLDNFKQLNDRFGHRVGDEVLTVFGEILGGATRRMDLSARWGGEEFITILASCPQSGAAHFAERVQRELRERPFPWGTVTVSAGVAEYSPGMGSSELLLAAADQALYLAKEEGRDRVRVAARPTLPPESRGAPGIPVGAIQPTVGGSPGENGASAVDLPGGDEVILLVDDATSMREGVARVLGALGYRVIQSGSGEEALLLARKRDRIDLLITDLLMPGMSGFTLGARFEAAKGPSRILYMSGDVQGDLSWKGAPGARMGFVEKPMTEQTLAGKVRELLDEPLP